MFLFKKDILPLNFFLGQQEIKTTSITNIQTSNPIQEIKTNSAFLSQEEIKTNGIITTQKNIPLPTLELKVISNTTDPKGIKDGLYKDISNNKFFGDSQYNWQITIKFNLLEFNNTLQCIIGNVQDDNNINNWGLWITPQRKLQWRISNSLWDLNNFGELKNNTIYQIDIRFNNGKYNFSFLDLSINKLTEFFNLLDNPQIIIDAEPIYINTGVVTFGGDFTQSNINSKFLGDIIEIKSAQVIPAALNKIIFTRPPIKPYYVINDPSGIENGKYNNIPFSTFGLYNYLNNWTINILFTNYKSSGWQGIIGNMYNSEVTLGWGIWISDQKYINFRIGNWNANVSNIKIIEDTPYKLIIDYNNGVYKLTLINMNNDSFNIMEVKEEKLLSDKGAICVGGGWSKNTGEKFVGKIDYVDFYSNQPITMAPTTSIGPKIIKPYYVIQDSSGIENGGYRNIPFSTFGLNNNLNNWTINILFTQTYSGNWQGIIGNMYNNEISYGWGIWISDEKYVYFRIGDWTSKVSNIKIENNVLHKLIINYNDGIYKITLIIMNDNSSTNMEFKDKGKLISNTGSICIGGMWLKKPDEKFIGNIFYVDFISP